MTHDEQCKFDPKWCHDCIVQGEARASERDKFRRTLLDMAAKYPVLAYVFQQVYDTVQEKA